MLTHLTYYLLGEPEKLYHKGGLLYELQQRSYKELQRRNQELDAWRKRFRRWPY